MEENNSPIINIGDFTIDIRKVCKVGPVAGDASWLRYTVYLDGGASVEIYEDRGWADGHELPQMRRERFIELWRSINP